MKKVKIIGAGGLGREIASWIETSRDDIEVVGFLDDADDRLEGFDQNLPWLGKLAAVNPKDLVLMGIMDCKFKELFFEKNPDLTYVSYFHQSSVIGQRTSFGKGLMIMPNSCVSCDVKIGDLVFINLGTQIGHDVVIGDFCSIMANVDLGGGVVLGNNVFIGSGATILPGVNIPDHTRIGAGCVVLKSIKKAGTYFGNPAKLIY